MASFGWTLTISSKFMASGQSTNTWMMPSFQMFKLVNAFGLLKNSKDDILVQITLYSDLKSRKLVSTHLQSLSSETDYFQEKQTTNMQTLFHIWLKRILRIMIHLKIARQWKQVLHVKIETLTWRWKNQKLESTGFMLISNGNHQHTNASKILMKMNFRILSTAMVSMKLTSAIIALIHLNRLKFSPKCSVHTANTTTIKMTKSLKSMKANMQESKFGKSTTTGSLDTTSNLFIILHLIKLWFSATRIQILRMALSQVHQSHQKLKITKFHAASMHLVFHQIQREVYLLSRTQASAEVGRHTHLMSLSCLNKIKTS